MNTDRLYQIVKGLTEKDVKSFLAWVKSSSTRKTNPKYLLLFKRLRQQSEFNETKLKKGLFRSSSHFVQEKSNLIEKLIECFASQRNNSGQKLSMILTSLEFNAIDQAKKYFSEEYTRAFSEGELSYCNFLIDTGLDFLHDHKIDLLKNLEPCASKVREYYQIFRSLKELHTKSLKVLKGNHLAKTRIANEIDQVIRGNQVDSPPVLAYLYKKLKVSSHLLRGDYGRAFPLQQEFTNWIIEGNLPFVQPVHLLRELSSAIIASLWLNDRKSAMAFSFRLSDVNDNTSIVAEMKERFWTLRTIETAYAFLDGQLLKRGLESLLQSPHLFSSKEFSSKLYRAAVTYLYLGNWPQARFCIREIRKLPKSKWGEMTWQPEILRTVISYFSGSIQEDWDSFGRSVKRSIEKETHYFPTLIFKTIEGLGKARSEDQTKKILKEAQSEFEKLIKNPDEKRQSLFFDFDVFLKAAMKGKTMSEISTEEKSQILQQASGDL